MKQKIPEQKEASQKAANIESIIRVFAAESAELAALHQQSFPVEEQWSAQSIAEMLTFPYVWAGGAIWQAKLVGMVMIRSLAGEAEILTLCVHPHWRRYGAARALVAWAQVTALQTGAERLFLEVSIHNTGAIALYKQAGFVRCGLRKRYYADGSDAYICEKILLKSEEARSFSSKYKPL